MIDLVVVLVVLASLAMSALRWLRVAQREHYVPGRVRAIQRLWLSRSIRDVVLGLVAALWLMERVERRLSAPFVARAQRRLARVRPQVVAVTGSYGKTSTKGYIAH